MFAWGSTIHGELGLGGIEDEHILTPRSLDWVEAENIESAVLGDNHTLLLTKDGKIYSCGNNDFGQLGHVLPRKTPQLVSGLDAEKITIIACGATHSLALNEWGQVFAWGSDLVGQLGHKLGQDIQRVPKIVKRLNTYHVVQIACGQQHSVALTNGGELFAWGSNHFGELGMGWTSSFESVPNAVASLHGIPLAFISCGYNHTFAISKSGAVFGWGKNTQGQLGLSDTTSKCFPTQLETLRYIRVRYISCGENFSAFLTMDGGVLSCGSGAYGQLGHGTRSNEILPRQVVELMGSTITQISCGRQHTLALVPSRGRIYSFGVGGSGQLGILKLTNASTPQVVLGPWVSPNGASVVPTNSSAKNVVQMIFAGGDHSFVTVKKKDEIATPHDCRVYNPTSQIIQLDYDYMLGFLNLSSNKPVDQEMMSYLECAFKSLACWNASFLLPNNGHYCCSSKHHGIDIALAEIFFSLVGKFENNTVKELIWNSVVEDIIPKLLPSPPDVESLRIYLVIPLYHEFNNPKQHSKLHKPFSKALLQLSGNPNEVVGTWWRMMTKDYYERLVDIFKSVVTFILRNQKIPENQTVFHDVSLVAMLDILAYLNKLNHYVEGFKVPYDTFHLPDLGDFLDVRVDYVLWLTDPGMQDAMQSAAEKAALTMLLPPNARHTITQFLFLNISRDQIVESALRELSDVDPNDLKKPLKIKFYGEEAEDAGGVRKEFFMLLLREILDPKYGMFKEYEETRAIWFSDNSFEEGDVYTLIGIICGLAIYNFTIIDIPFPLALYKKLLGEPVGLADLKGLSPLLANSLQSLLDYDKNDVQDVFGLTFEVTRDTFGEVKGIPLKPKGQKIPVTKENKQEYVNLYVDYIFNESVQTQYMAFSNGFMKVCGGRVLRLFHSHELMAVVVGNENYDWVAWEEAAEYENGYKSSTKTIRWFWEVIHEMSLEDKQKFLLFLTGSDRIPIQGMSAIKIIIQKINDDKYLPVAHTCFNLLDLPEYKTKEKLRYKLMQAIQQNQGFSLV